MCHFASEHHRYIWEIANNFNTKKKEKRKKVEESPFFVCITDGIVKLASLQFDFINVCQQYK
jgi:hypothetical protein